MILEETRPVGDTRELMMLEVSERAFAFGNYRDEPQCESSATHYAILLMDMKVLDLETTEAFVLRLEIAFNTLRGL
jgi:hypothetical protein